MMGRSLFVLVFAVAAVISLAVLGCKAKVEKTEADMQVAVGPEVVSTTTTEEMIAVPEPAQSIGTETIPPTAAVATAPVSASGVPIDQLARNKDIQTALSKAGFYTGAIDGKIGPKTKAAIKQFQQARGLKVDGKVGPKTWAELQKFLFTQ
jgi:peptidoglycan hydrolase-like protein with peptidoglycan-binding domain